MALSSPGVEVKVIDESFYTPAAPGTVPLIVVATAENKLNGAGDGIAPGTLKANAGRVYLVTSQKDLVDTFGDPVFKTDNNNNPIHVGEQNEYGLQAAYSALGVSNRAFIVRADIDLNMLNAAVDAPASSPENGTHWLDTQSSAWGIFEWNDNPVTTTGGQTFVSKTPIVITDPKQVDSTNSPLPSIGKNGSYAVVCVKKTSTTELTHDRPLAIWYRTSSGQWVIVGSEDWRDLDGGRELAISPHTQVPDWKRPASVIDRPASTGSVWIKTTEPNAGARWRVNRYNTVTQRFDALSTPLYANHLEAIYNLDRAGGGNKIPVGQVYVKFNKNEYSDAEATFTVYRKRATAPTTIRTEKITTQLTAGTNTFIMAESTVGSLTLSQQTVSFSAVKAAIDAETIATAINSAGFVNVEASVDAQNRLVITHELGGEIHFADAAETPLSKLGFQAYNLDNQTGMLNLEEDVDGDHDFVATLWQPLIYTIGRSAPTTLTADGTLWYSSTVDQIDIMVHDGESWVGYNTRYPETDAQGPIVSATEPNTQTSGSSLEDNDLWISTADMENFPIIYRYSKALVKWILVDKSDQSTDEGILFADARWAISGDLSKESTIEELLTSDYLDPDAPDPALYPRGMLLWNTRRSGFNVKEFKRNYIDTTRDNIRNLTDTEGGVSPEAMTNYFPHRWVTASSNQDDGSGSFGAKAQRKVVVKALQALVNSNQDIRDDESRIFNLIACPGYPELIGELIGLNYDRGLTAFIIGDTPPKLTPDATSLLDWGNNANLALEDNQIGAVSFDEYMSMFYPWGFTSDNFGNNVVVPPSHMILRTMILNDQVAYPWFAPAGVRRGGITNATAVGYVDSEGEFNSVALNTGQRDTLYDVKVNPITFLTGTGLVNYGQKTRARSASALDRINVARLVIYLRRQLSVLAKPYIFEPNDKQTRDEIKGAVESLLLELVGQRALYDFLVVCDESNNTPSRIDRNELWIDIAIEPVKAIEFIYIPLRLKNTGEISGL